MRLVVRARPEPTESLMGFALRLTEINGYPSSAYVLAAMGKVWYLPNVGRLDAAGLATLAGLGQGDVDRLTHRPAERPRAYVRVYGSDLPSYEVNLRHPKVCPACLAEGRTCEAFWDLAQAAVCPTHRVHLVSQCPACSNRLLWARAKVSQCKCGFDLRSAISVSAAPALAELMAVVRHKVYQDDTLASLPPSMSHLSQLDLRRLCKLIWVMSGVVHQARGGRRAPKARCHYRDHLEVVATALGNWPSGFRTFLSSTYNSVIQESQELPHFAVMFSWLLVRLIKNDEGDRTAFEFLERELYLFGAQHWTRASMGREENALRLMPEKIRWGTMSEACELTGLHQLTLKKRVASGEIKSRRIKNKSNRAIVVDMDSIREQKLTQYPAVGIREAASQLGVSVETLKELRSNGAYEENYQSIFPGSLTKEDVDALASRLQSIRSNKRAINTPEIVTLDDVFHVFLASPSEKAAIFKRILSDPALVVGRKRGSGPGRLQVFKSVITEHFESTRLGREKCLTVHNAAALLGCTPDIVTALKKSGHIKTRKTYGRYMPIEASVIEFDKKYEAVPIASKRVGSNSKAAYSRIDFGELNHVKVKTTQHSTIFVLRIDVPRFERMLIAVK